VSWEGRTHETWIQYFCWKALGEVTLGRPRRLWENIRMDLRKICLELVNRIRLTQDRDQWRPRVHSNEPSGSIKDGKILDHLSDSFSRTVLHQLVND
jgi:hypothetical protein